MLLYVALQAIPARRHTLFPPILAATVPLAHAAVAFGRAFRPSAVEAATATSTTRATRTTSRCTEETSFRSVRWISYPTRFSRLARERQKELTQPVTVRLCRAVCNEPLRARCRERTTSGKGR